MKVSRKNLEEITIMVQLMMKWCWLWWWWGCIFNQHTWTRLIEKINNKITYKMKKKSQKIFGPSGELFKWNCNFLNARFWTKREWGKRLRWKNPQFLKKITLNYGQYFLTHEFATFLLYDYFWSFDFGTFWFCESDSHFFTLLFLILRTGLSFFNSVIFDFDKPKFALWVISLLWIFKDWSSSLGLESVKFQKYKQLGRKNWKKSHKKDDKTMKFRIVQ